MSGRDTTGLHAVSIALASASSEFFLLLSSMDTESGSMV